jgi:hypothetical protein
MATFIGDEPGNIENRRADRVAANFSVSFREIDEAEAERLNEAKGGVPELPVESPKAPSQAQPGPMSAAGHTENISQGGISLTGDLQLLGDRRLERGKKLIVEFTLPGERLPVSAVAVVVWSIEGKGEHGKFTAGLMFTGVEAGDLDKIQRYVEGQNK